MKIVAVIPARYRSTRFPGKPLADIEGKPMIWHVYQNCKKVPEFENVYVATDDERIAETCSKYGMEYIMTSKSNATGTDRVAEVASKVSADIYVNVQGDEPLLEPEVINMAIPPLLSDSKLLVSNLMTAIHDPVEVINNTVPKVITNRENRGIYLSRSATPSPKGCINYSFFKQVCVYGFRPEALEFYSEYYKKYGKAKIEEIEDIEILRFIENGITVQFVEVNSNTIAVDTPNDLEKVRLRMKMKTQMVI